MNLAKPAVLALVAAVISGCASAGGVPERGPTTGQRARATSCCYQPDLQGWARDAVAGGRAGEHAIARLRNAGPLGLEVLLDVHEAEAAHPGPALRSAIERVAAQRDAHVSRLYWYTDLETAKRVAQRDGKPILSLRLLGRLDEELSCANSRFFRTALYPDSDVSRRLREAFVLHWSSERPAPKITIDFGDGRRLERTITGNSIHYVLDADGRVVDALPGLYGPREFLERLTDAEAIEARVRRAPPEEREEALRAWHRARIGALDDAWVRELGPGAAPLAPIVAAGFPAPPARLAVPIAVSKAMVEAPVVQAIQGPVLPLPSPANGAAWQAFVSRAAEREHLDANSRALVRAKMAPTDDAGFARRLGAFERAMAEDTVRNELTLHRIVHEWLAMSPAPRDLETLDARVYASLFLTPRSDPWLGLMGDAYSGIEGDGVVVQRGARP